MAWSADDQRAWGAGSLLVFACLRIVDAYVRSASPGAALSLDYAFFGGAVVSTALLLTAAPAAGAKLATRLLGGGVLLITIAALVVLIAGYQLRLCSKGQKCEEASPRFYAADQGLAWAYAVLALCVAMVAVPSADPACAVDVARSAGYVGALASAACTVFLTAMGIDIFYLTTDG